LRRVRAIKSSRAGEPSPPPRVHTRANWWYAHNIISRAHTDTYTGQRRAQKSSVAVLVYNGETTSWSGHKRVRSPCYPLDNILFLSLRSYMSVCAYKIYINYTVDIRRTQTAADALTGTAYIVIIYIYVFIMCISRRIFRWHFSRRGRSFKIYVIVFSLTPAAVELASKYENSVCVCVCFFHHTPADSPRSCSRAVMYLHSTIFSGGDAPERKRDFQLYFRGANGLPMGSR